jgi:hypothetical protein
VFAADDRVGWVGDAGQFYARQHTLPRQIRCGKPLDRRIL